MTWVAVRAFRRRVDDQNAFWQGQRRVYIHMWSRQATKQPRQSREMVLTDLDVTTIVLNNSLRCAVLPDVSLPLLTMSTTLPATLVPNLVQLADRT